MSSSDPKVIAETPLASLRTLRDRCNDYLQHGGFFNPELMDTRKVSELIEDYRALLTDLEAAQQTEKDEDLSRVAPSSTLHSIGSTAHSANGSAETLKAVEVHIDAARDRMNEASDFASREYFRGWHDAYRNVRNLLRAGEAVASRPAAQEPAESHPYAEGTLLRAQHDIRTRDAVIEYLQAKLAAAAPVIEGARPPAEDLVAIRAAWQVAVDRNIALDREIETLRVELTKQQERNSPQ